VNIIFIGRSSFASSDLVNDLNKKATVFFSSRKRYAKKKDNFYFDLNSKNKYLLNKFKKKKISYLFFFASYVPINEKKSSWVNCYKTNILGVINLIKNLNFSIKKIVFISSCSLYGSCNSSFNENTFLKPETPYSLSKFSQESIFRIFCQLKEIKFVAYRLGYVYGKNMNPKRLVKRIFDKLQNKKRIKIYNKKYNLNLIHTKDISNIILSTYKKAEGIFNLTNKYKITINNFLLAIYKSKKNVFLSNNFSSNKIIRKFPKIKFLKLKEGIQSLKSYD
jgi:nucleoside-diphosphate-sugar epimerase